MRPAKAVTNPAGRTGKPIILPPTTFDDAVKRIVATPLPLDYHTNAGHAIAFHAATRVSVVSVALCGLVWLGFFMWWSSYDPLTASSNVVGAG